MSFYGKSQGLFGSGGGGATSFTQGAPSGAIDGVNVTFTLSGVPTANSSVFLFLDGGIQYQGIGLDYTVSGAVITMTVAPVVNQTLWAIFS